jgi:hypothetical protein
MKFIKFVCVAIFQNKTLLWKILKTVKSNIIFHKYPENKTLLWGLAPLPACSGKKGLLVVVIQKFHVLFLQSLSDYETNII